MAQMDTGVGAALASEGIQARYSTEPIEMGRGVAKSM